MEHERGLHRWRLCWRACVDAGDADWRVAETEHFVVYANTSEASLRRYAEQLEKFDKALRLARGLKEAPLGKAGARHRLFCRQPGPGASLAGDSEIAGFYIHARAPR